MSTCQVSFGFVARSPTDDVVRDDVGTLGSQPTTSCGSGDTKPSRVGDVASRTNEIAKSMVVSPHGSNVGLHAFMPQASTTVSRAPKTSS